MANNNRTIHKGCENCPTRKYYAKYYDFHFDRLDCPVKDCKPKHRRKGDQSG